MPPQDEIVKPIKGKNSPSPGSLCLLIGTLNDTESLERMIPAADARFRRLFTSRFTPAPQLGGGVSITGPIVGAPYAVMVLETLIAWGARRFIFWGWSGAISREVGIGDIIVPSAAIIDEGTSLHYGAQLGSISRPADSVTELIVEGLVHQGCAFHRGSIWTTDGIFRETAEKVKAFQSRGALAVEMELSALFTAACFRQVELGGLLVVSDELSTYRWRPGFKDERFKQGRLHVLEVLSRICRKKSRPPSANGSKN